MKMSDEPLILVVDDDPDFLNGIIRTLESKFADASIMGASGGEKADEIIRNGEVGVLLTDLRMPGISGMELLETALKYNPDICVIMITGYATVENAVESLKKGAWDFITKPVERDELFHAVEKALEHYRLAFENKRLKNIVKSFESDQDSGFLSQSMKMLMEQVRAVASAEYTVLITGESGSGKEYIARQVHRFSKRKDQVCNSINCAAIPEQLLESELFGHVKGAFTGADRSRRGFFPASDKGTLILDEIGDISPALQVKLLKFLQDREVKPVGSSDSKKVDVRIIALTNRNLQQKIETGEFREDLYYRLNVLSLEVPPLRQRKEDIPILVRTFLDLTCRELGIDRIETDTGAMSYLSSLPWNGNVRELQNFIRRLAVFSGGSRIDMSLVNIVEGKKPEQSVKQEGKFRKYKDAKKDVVDSFSRDYLYAVLEDTKGNISQASRISGLERMSVQKIIKRLGIDISKFKIE